MLISLLLRTRTASSHRTSSQVNGHSTRQRPANRPERVMGLGKRCRLQASKASKISPNRRTATAFIAPPAVCVCLIVLRARARSVCLQVPGPGPGPGPGVNSGMKTYKKKNVPQEAGRGKSNERVWNLEREPPKEQSAPRAKDVDTKCIAWFESCGTYCENTHLLLPVGGDGRDSALVRSLRCGTSALSPRFRCWPPRPG
jgi:hypothetical protein